VVPFAGFLGALTVVTFVPSDVRLVDGPPSLRRAFLNTALVQRDPNYYAELSRYHNALRQKNAVLRASPDPDAELLAVYDRVLVESGARVAMARRAFVDSIAPEAHRVHTLWSSGERLDLRYAPDVPIGAEPEDGVREAIALRLRELAPVERRRRGALAGPHRDDIEIFLDGRPLNALGSQGQRRTAVLALKVAEYIVMRDASGEAPLLLLDDVLSELDARRAAAFLAGVGEYEQAYVTATHPPEFLPEASALFSIDAANVRRA
jgi:DNA replication and repair protein RecF